MKDLISRQAAIELAMQYCLDDDGTCSKADEDIRNLLDELEDLPPAQPEQRWIPVTEQLPEEDHCLGGSGQQFSDEVLVSVVNWDDEDAWCYISQTVDGVWQIALPRHCEVIAWLPLPEPYQEGEQE